MKVTRASLTTHQKLQSCPQSKAIYFKLAKLTSVSFPMLSFEIHEEDCTNTSDRQLPYLSMYAYPNACHIFQFNLLNYLNKPNIILLPQWMTRIVSCVTSSQYCPSTEFKAAIYSVTASSLLFLTPTRSSPKAVHIACLMTNAFYMSDYCWCGCKQEYLRWMW